jgi:hypothetical protein
MHATLGRAPLDEWSARHRDVCPTTHNAHRRHTSIIERRNSEFLIRLKTSFISYFKIVVLLHQAMYVIWRLREFCVTTRSLMLQQLVSTIPTAYQLLRLYEIPIAITTVRRLCAVGSKCSLHRAVDRGLWGGGGGGEWEGGRAPGGAGPGGYLW